MIISGRNPVIEAKKSGKAKKIIVRQGASIHFDNINIPFEVLGRRAFEEKYGTETQGVVCEVDDFEYTDLKDILKKSSQIEGVVFLDKIQDPHNFGAVIRACHCFGIRHIIVPRHDQAKVSPAVYKASAGSLFYTEICEVVNLGQAIDEFKSKGFPIAAADINGDINLKSTSSIVKFPLGVIIGSEGRGIRESILERADYKLKIGMSSDIDSLNASMSCAVILYQLFSR